MSKDERVSIALHSEEKAEWEEHVDEDNEVTNLSHLIRRSVSDRYSGDQDGDSSNVGGGLTDTDRSKINRIASGVDSLKDTVETLDERLSVVEEGTKQQSELAAIKDDVYHLLPRVEPGTEEWESADFWNTESREEWNTDLEDGIPIADALADTISGSRDKTNGSVTQIASFLDVGTNWVRAAAEELLENTPHVHRTTVDGRQYYWTER